MSAAAPPPTPTVIAQRYELQRMLAQGGMAEVWLAIDLTLDRKVAVKWLKPNLASDEIVTERFRREAIAAASLNHPNIVAVHDVFEQDGRQAVVMQLIEGKSLRQLLDTQTRLSPELTCHIGTCVAAALDHAHEAGFVHRDVKPGNIMITSDGRVLLTDFGIAKGLQTAESDLTSDNIMMGTAKYLSPEQVRGKKLDGRADLYSLGLVLYECLAGRVPFLGETDADTALARLQRDPTDLSRLRATLPTGLVVVIHQLLSRNPAHRPATGGELAIRLRDAAKEGPPHIDPTPHERSPVAPFGGRRLRRAPSDVAGRATDRARATRARDDIGESGEFASQDASRSAGRRAPTDPPLPQRKPIPGEVAHTGLVATAAATASVASRPADAPTPHADRTPPTATAAVTPPSSRSVSGPQSRVSQADRTPPAGHPIHGRPAKGMTQGWKPSFTVLAILLLVGLVVGLLVWTSLQFGGSDPVTSTTALPGDDATADGGAGAGGDEVDNSTAADAGGVVGPATILTTTAYDPDGDSIENDSDAVLADADGDPSTYWSTVCYESQYMGAKRGVGLVVSFDGLAQAPIKVDVQSAPYQLQFFTSTGESVPTTLDEWGAELGTKAFSNDPGTVVSATPTEPVRHVLILLNELGQDTTCSTEYPYRGRLGEVAVAS